jgi:threonine/homoserine/homoserine lactone efflux protein
MIASYKRKSNIAAAIFVVSIGAGIVLSSNSHQNLWDMGVIGPALGITWTVSYFYALMSLIKAKGRSDAWILMAFLSLLGLIVLLCLKDQRKEDTTAAAT